MDLVERPSPRSRWVAGYGSDTGYDFANPGSSFQNAPGSQAPSPGSSFQATVPMGAPVPLYGGSYDPTYIGQVGYPNPSASGGNPWMTNWGSSPATTSPDYFAAKNQYGYDQGIQAGLANTGVQRAQLQGDIAGYGIGIQGALAGQTYGTGVLNQNYGTDVAHLANQQAANQVDIAANARQPGFLTALHGTAGQQYDLARLGEKTNADVNRRQLESQLTSRGAFTSVGGQQGRFDIANQLLQQTQGTNLQQQAETQRYFESMAQAGDQKQKLDLQAKDYGITGDELRNHLQQGLDRLNLSTGTSIADLMNKIGSGNLQEAAIAQQILNNAMQNSDYYARLYPGQNAAAGTYNPVVGSGTERTYGGGGGTFR